MLPDLALLVPFLLAGLLLITSPGPDTIYVAARSLAQGPGVGVGVVAALAVSLGVIGHSAAVALGLAGVFAYAPVAFDVLRWGGVAYLLYLAFTTLTARDDATTADAPKERRNLPRVFRQALTTNLLNPKVILFFVAFLPQFTQPEKGSVGLQMFSLGVLISVMGGLWLVLIAFAAGGIGLRVARHKGLRRLQRWTLGGALTAVAIWLAVPERR